MPNPFDSSAMAAGYANARPPVHPRVMELASPALQSISPIHRALDIGCGAGLSTRALLPFARHVFALDPVEAMLRSRHSIAPQAHFLTAAAETLPFAPHQFDLIAAAGSLNFIHLDRFFPEAFRVLKPTGMLLVYDYSHGRNFATNDTLDPWFTTFLQRYPPAPSQARPLNPQILRTIHPRFALHQHQSFAIPIPLTLDFYIGYLLTSTNIAAAIQRGTPAPEIRHWCASTLAPIWLEPQREILFHGYFACLRPLIRDGSPLNTTLP